MTVIQHARHCCLKRGQFVLHNVPYDLAVDSKVFVDQNVSEARDLFPVDARSVVASPFGKMLRCFSDHLQISDDGVEGLVVLEKFGFGEAACI